MLMCLMLILMALTAKARCRNKPKACTCNRNGTSKRWRSQFKLNAGLRYEQTDVVSTVKQRVEKQVNWESASEWIMKYQAAGTNDFLSLEGDHDLLLPMLDIKVDVTDDVVARFSWGKTIARAPLGNLAGGRSLSGSPKPGSRTGGQGNPSLLPFTSTNLDLSF